MNPTTRILLAALSLFAGTEAVFSAQGKSTNAVSGEDLFAQPQVHRLKIEISDSAMEALRHEPRHYVKATVREGSQVYADVGVRLKGGTNSPPIDKKPGLSLKFNEFSKDQAFHGETRILLSHSQSDPTYLCDAIASEIFHAAGVPAARVSFARVELNGRDLGVYVIGEAINKEFLSRHFKKTKGNLYEGSHVDVTEKLEKDSGDNSTEQADVRALARAAKEADAAQRWKKLGAILDTDRFISMAAAEVLLWHRDGYVLGRNNYRLYHDPASDQMIFLPHDVDQICSPTDGPILPEWQGLVAKGLLSTPAAQQQYLEKLGKLLNSGFKVETLQARVDELAQIVRPALPAGDSNVVRTFDGAVKQLRERISRRAVFVQQALKNPPAPPK